MKMILRDKDRNSLCEIAKKCFKVPVEIWGYGSRVNGDCHEGSDLDLVVVNRDEKVNIRKMYLEFVDQLRESNIPILVDVKEWNSIPISFQNNIIRKYEVVCIVS
jgi:predicted nucleotidyltransferase